MFPPPLPSLGLAGPSLLLPYPARAAGPQPRRPSLLASLLPPTNEMLIYAPPLSPGRCLAQLSPSAACMPSASLARKEGSRPP